MSSEEDQAERMKAEFSNPLAPEEEARMKAEFLARMGEPRPNPLTPEEARKSIDESMLAEVEENRRMMRRHLADTAEIVDSIPEENSPEGLQNETDDQV